MELDDAVRAIKYLQNRGVRLWVDGGWGVDALLGEQTRPHDDLDIAVELADRDIYELAVADAGYRFHYYDPDNDAADGTHLNWVVKDSAGRELDVHLVDTSVIVSRADGAQLYGAIPYPVGSLDGSGVIGGFQVPCLTADYQLVSHTGYEIRDKDIHDVGALCARFSLPVPPEYSGLVELT